MKSVNKQFVICFLLGFTLSGCASTGTESDLGSDIEYNGSDCISIRTIRDYRPLDNRNLLIEAAGKRNYLVTLLIRYGKKEPPEQERPAPELEGAEVEELGEIGG